jgi:hypothetical protein
MNDFNKIFHEFWETLHTKRMYKIKLCEYTTFF